MAKITISECNEGWKSPQIETCSLSVSCGCATTYCSDDKYHELYIIRRGKGIFEIDGKSYFAKEGRAFFIKKGLERSIRNNNKLTKINADIYQIEVVDNELFFVDKRDIHNDKPRALYVQYHTYKYNEHHRSGSFLAYQIIQRIRELSNNNPALHAIVFDYEIDKGRFFTVRDRQIVFANDTELYKAPESASPPAPISNVVRITEDFAASIVDRFLSSSQEADILRRAFAKVGHTVSAGPLAEATIKPPTSAPALWSERGNDSRNPVKFLREVYAKWIDAGVMTRKSVYKCDKALANAYAQWIYRHPEDVISFAGTTRPGRSSEPDPVKAIERVRAKSRARSARYRAGQLPAPGDP